MTRTSHRLLGAAIAITAVLAPHAPGARAQELPLVRLVATGGTISNQAGGRLTAADFVERIPEAARYARIEHEQFSNVASSALTLAQFLDLARRLNTLFQSNPDLAGIVVTCGTDTLEELAYFLHLTVRDERPVVVVGAMRNASSVGYEGTANLLEGFRVAASPDSRGKGVLVVLNDEINSAREATKTDALRLHTFQSRPAGVLGVVDPDRVVYYRLPARRHTARSEFDVTAITALPRVDVLLMYQEAPGDLVRAAVDLGARGLVMAVAGAGATSASQSEALRYAAGKGVVVVSSTRTGSGRVSPPRLPGGPSGLPPDVAALLGQFVGAEDLMPVKARILLMLALTRTTHGAEIQRMFREY